MQSDVLGAQPWRADLVWPPGFAAGIAHRLDVPTSGALWLADDVAELDTMRAWFGGGSLRKTYRFRTGREVPWDEHVVDAMIGHDKRRRSRMVVRRGANTPHRGKWYAARTELRRVRGSLWEAVITTGVTHQIRLHAAFVGIPLRGDRLYGGGEALDPSVPFQLHHVGIVGPDGVGTEPVPLPEWAEG